MRPGLRPTSVPRGKLIHPAVWPQYMGRKVGVAAPPFLAGVAGSPSNTILPGPRPTSVPNSILIHPAVWPQQTWAENWGVCPFWREELGPYLTQCGRGRGLHPCQVSSSSIQPFGHNTPTMFGPISIIFWHGIAY